MSKAVKIKADLMWANLQKRNDMSGKYQVDLCNLSPAAVGALEDMGLAVKSKEDKGFFITCKSNNPIHAYDDNGNDLSEVLVGNGSEAICAISTYDWEFRGKKGISPSLRRLVVTKLETYDDAEAEMVDEDDEVL